MVFTTRAKIILKKYAPKWLFDSIRLVSSYTLLRLIPLYFRLRISRFKERVTKHIHYQGGHFDIIIDPSNGYLDAQIYAHGLYEPHIVHELTTHIKPGDTCIDVGANIGHHTIIMSKASGTTGHVYAYEPIPHIRKQAEESVAQNTLTNVTFYSDALSDSASHLDLHVRKGNIGGSSLVATSTNDEYIKVNVRTLDSYYFTKVDFIKIDVEGYEYHVLLGAKDLIQKHRPVILFEYSPIYYRIHNVMHSLHILSFFREHNYNLIDLEDRKKPIISLEKFIREFDHGLRSQTNILAVPRTIV